MSSFDMKRNASEVLGLKASSGRSPSDNLKGGCVDTSAKGGSVDTSAMLGLQAVCGG
jgi:hypothetical protein